MPLHPGVIWEIRLRLPTPQSALGTAPAIIRRHSRPKMFCRRSFTCRLVTPGFASVRAVRNEGASMKKSVFYLSSAITLLFWASVSAQEKPPLVPNNLAVAQDFLRTFYPDLNNKHYFLNVETSLYYDSQGSPFRGFWLKISNGSISDQGHQHNLAAGCSQGSVQAYQAPSGGFISGECPPPFPQQFLSSAFQFDEAGHLE